MTALQYARAERITLKGNPEFDEKWLQDRIAEEASILGLGEIDLIERERRQNKAGRLDLLLQDTEQNTRYEVELMLGATDESHIIRCIEYWDIERRRYPGYEHVAVLVAEDITSRFLNVLGLFGGTIPLIAIQFNALNVGEQIILDFVKVIDQMQLRTDDEAEKILTVTDRNYWNNRAPETIPIVDKLFSYIDDFLPGKFNLNYNKSYVGLLDSGRSRNVVHFRVRKKYVALLAKISDKDEWINKFDDAGLNSRPYRHWVIVDISKRDFDTNQDLLRNFLEKVLKEDQGQS
jgi:hypothetical protein